MINIIIQLSIRFDKYTDMDIIKQEVNFNRKPKRKN